MHGWRRTPHRATSRGWPSDRGEARPLNAEIMTRTLVRIARTLYKATPVPAVRQLYFSAFCRVMRERRVRATINGTTFDLDLGEMIDVALYLEQYEPDVTAALNR